MTAIPLVSHAHIRRVNVRQDLLAVADLIEICFASTLDEDGRDYLRQLRWAARDMTYLSWFQGAAERIATPLYGFVWEEDEQIVGNLSLIPLYRRGKIIYLIANVAVHPDYRRRGIARSLTEAALDHLRQRSVDGAWLQVRDDNPVAYHLYLSLGFNERARRTTWLGKPSPMSVRQHPGDITVHRRRSQDWDQQAAWLRRTYPPEVAWNLPLYYARLSPQPWQQFMRFLRGETQEHWAAHRGELPVGFLSWEPSRSSSDTLWLAAPPELEDQAILALLPHARETLIRRGRSLSLNYPAGRGGEAFLRTGFSHHQTLIWMTVSLNSQ
jgi:ribosomal protein S18 acetylase RimI-like enzyme